MSTFIDMTNFDEEDISPFRSPLNRKHLTKALFFETSFPTKDQVRYTLKEVEHMGYPSLYKLYMEANDPTEWKVATTYFDGWDHWEILCGLAWFKPYVTKWRRDLELRMKSQALARIQAEAKTNSRDSLSASKYLLEKGWEKEAPKRGRPTKDDIKKAANEMVNSQSQLLSDFERLGINLEEKGN